MYALIAAIAGAVMTGLAAWSLGRATLRSPVPWPLHLAAGAAQLSLIVVALLLLHVAKPVVFVLTALACVAAALLRQPPLAERGEPAHRPWHLLLIVPFGALYLIHALAPEIQPDSLNYHLSLPMQARASGGFSYGTSFFDLIPQGMETLYAMAYSIGRDPAGKLVHFLFLGATLPLMGYAARLLSLPSQTARGAALFYAVTPVAGIAATCTYNDAALAFFALAAFCFALALLQEQTANGELAWAAGLCAGFCYATKFTGGIIAAAILLMVAYRRRWPDVWRFIAAASLIASPWLIRSAWLTGNPFAPLMSRLFPSPFFHVETEQRLSGFMRDYGVTWSGIPLELSVHGAALQGLVGPMWLLAPLGLLALRRSQGRIIWFGAAACMIPWFLNLGTRFTLPALPFIALAMFSVLPKNAAPAFLAAHAVLSWPSVVALYSSPGAWRMATEPPWRAAFGLENPADYRKRVSMESNVADLVRSHTTATDRILDLADIPAAATGRILINNWQTALGDRLFRSLYIGGRPEVRTLFEWKATFPPQSIQAARLTMLQAITGDSWTLHEIRVGGLPAKPTWTLAASINVWETPLAMDGNLTTFWSPWEATPAGTQIDVRMPEPVTAGDLRVVTGQQYPIKVEVLNNDWTIVPVKGPAPLPKLDLRLEAIKAVKREGIRYVLAQRGTEPLGMLGVAMGEAPGDWGLKLVAAYEFFALYHIE